MWTQGIISCFQDDPIKIIFNPIHIREIMSEEKSALEILYGNRDVKCKNPECGHVMDAHVNFKMIKEDRVLLAYCSECRTQGKECNPMRF